MSISRNTTAKKLLSELFLDDNLVYVFLHFLFKSFWQTLVLFSEATDAYNFYLSSRSLSIGVNGSTFRRSKPINGKYCPLVRHLTRNVQAIVYSFNSDTADYPDNVYCRPVHHRVSLPGQTALSPVALCHVHLCPSMFYYPPSPHLPGLDWRADRSDSSFFINVLTAPTPLPG